MQPQGGFVSCTSNLSLAKQMCKPLYALYGWSNSIWTTDRLNRNPKKVIQAQLLMYVQKKDKQKKVSTQIVDRFMTRAQ